MKPTQSLPGAYSPQWAYPPAPAGFQDWPWNYIFDFSADQPGGNGFVPGTIIQSLPLQFDDDADFLLRGMWGSDNPDYFGGNLDPALTSTFFQLRETNGRYLSDGPVALPNLAALQAQADPWPSTGSPAPCEPEIPVPAGGAMAVDIQVCSDPTLPIARPVLVLVGVKRYRRCS